MRNEGAMGSWCRSKRGAGADGMSPPPLKPQTDGGNLLLLKGYLWVKTQKTTSHISVVLSTQPGPDLPGNLLKIRTKRDKFMEGKQEHVRILYICISRP